MTKKKKKKKGTNLFGLWTKRFSLCRRASRACDGFNKSSTIGMIQKNGAMQKSKVVFDVVDERKRKIKLAF
jgi:hypothetical protein